MSLTEIMTSQSFFQNIFISRRPGVAIFAEIIKIVSMFIKTILKDSIKFKRIRIYISKWNLYLYFLIQQNLLISCEKMLMSTKLKGCVTSFIYFLDLLQVRYNCAKFHHCRISVTDFRERGLFAPPPPIHEEPKKPILNRVNSRSKSSW